MVNVGGALLVHRHRHQSADIQNRITKCSRLAFRERRRKNWRYSVSNVAIVTAQAASHIFRPTSILSFSQRPMRPMAAFTFDVQFIRRRSVL
jgi:hypothetical protein